MIIGFFLATIIGLLLGILGGGGSILTIPVLVYALKMDPKESIALSLAIVGIASLIGTYGHFKAKNIDLKVAAIFSPVAMLGTYLGAKLSVFFSGSTQLLIFAVVMLISAIFMFKGKSTPEKLEDDTKLNYPLIAVEGIFVGLLTGLIGVGGGFMIVPALVLLGKIPMKKAIGTSLLIISLKSFSGFAGYINTVAVDWKFLFQFSSFTIVGIFIGTYLIKFIPAQALKKSFAVFLIIMSVFILYKNKQKLESFTFTKNVQVKEIS